MTTTKTIGAAAGSLILLSSAALAAAPAVMGITADAAPTSAVEQAAEQTVAETAGIQQVEGQFSYDQGVTTSTEAIASVFAKAAATLCAAPGESAPAAAAGPIEVTAEGACLIQATVGDLAADEGADSYTIGCSCATNGPGGGAIANAEVSGVSLATLAALAA
ncbi:hypothetical protein [Adlercreutzia rubneri]|uniref:Uncharacterized protein n=1 Tax=Adlercreutzia rubneri TaxID=2916441 RepID=A0A7K1T589_9ACTN|nr:hypothetical protein [Adlercreutzia rubneri]MVN58742.1 hypothetical protein [Adlercreutzia rubneri]